MKTLKFALLLVILCAAAYPQTQDLGHGAFANERGPIMIAVDASEAIQNMESPYSLFIVYLAVKSDNKSIVVARNDVTLVYKDQEIQDAERRGSPQELRGRYP